MVSIKEVADRAGVSVATVSRVLNDSAGVSAAARKKVLQAAEELGYQPSLLGRHLRRKQTNIILVMLSSLSNTFCAKVIRGIEKEARQNGYQVLISATGHEKELEQSCLDLVRKRLADGVIVLNSSLSAEEMRQFAGQHALVQCCEYIDTQVAPLVSIDNFAAAYEAVRCLADAGRRRIAFLGADEINISTRLRRDGYKKALQDAGLSFDESLLFYSNYGYRHTLSATREFLQTGVELDAIFAISDTMAAAAVSVLKETGRRIPEDVAVIGFDNTEVSYMTEPGLTTVSQPQAELGRAAFRMLLNKLQGRPVEHIFLQHALVKRQSV